MRECEGGGEGCIQDILQCLRWGDVFADDANSVWLVVPEVRDGLSARPVLRKVQRERTRTHFEGRIWSKTTSHTPASENLSVWSGFRERALHYPTGVTTTCEGVGQPAVVAVGRVRLVTLCRRAAYHFSARANEKGGEGWGGRRKP